MKTMLEPNNLKVEIRICKEKGRYRMNAETPEKDCEIILTNTYQNLWN
jgi:hypothetical protein